MSTNWVIEEETDITNNKNSTDSDVSISIENLMNNSTFQLVIKIIVGCILFLVIFAGLAFVYSKLAGTPIKMSGLKEIELKMPTFKKNK